MFASFLVSLIDFSRKYAAYLALGALLASVGLAVYVARNISINTDINQLLSEDLPWRQRQKALEEAFPQKADTTVVVIDADNGMKAEAAAEALAERLKAETELFSFVNRPDALPFFRTNGLLYLSTTELAATLDQMTQAQPMLAIIVSDPSLRGFFGTIGMMLQGVQAGAMDKAQIEKPLAEISASLRAALAGKDQPLNWQNLMPDGQNPPNAARELRKYIIAKPKLDFSALEPGAKTSDFIRTAAAQLNLAPENGVRVRLTGAVPLNDEEFASVAEGTRLALVLSAILVLGLLFAAMKSWKIVLPIALTLAVGLIASTAFATFAVGSLNLISVAFAVMFIGIAVDFGIQFGVRFRDAFSEEADYAKALRNTALVIATPLAMAAASTALGFFSFIPTEYRGVSELGVIAGAGMLIAFVLNVTLLPALITLLKPPAEGEPIGFGRLARLNGFLTTRGKYLIPALLGLAAIGLVIAFQVRFDFDPLDLKDPATESASTMFEIMKDPDSDAYAAQILVPPEQVAPLVAQLEKIPEADHVMTLNSFIPEDQDAKLVLIADTAALLEPTLSLPKQPAATFNDNVDAARKMAAGLHQAEVQLPAAKELADVLDTLVAQASPELFDRAAGNIVAPMQAKVGEISALLRAKPVTLANIPAELRRDWVAPDGRMLVEVFPKRVNDNPRDPATLARFIDAVEKIAPGASGTPVSIRESGRTIISAFIHAGIYGLVSIALLSLLVMRRVKDVFFMLAPLVLAGILSLATIALAGMPLNFANIIALPLLFSLGVSYAVYFVFFARAGRRDFLQSSMARAVLFSAATVLVAFASLCFSSHPGTRGMGELLTIALIYSLVCTFFMLPVLYGFGEKDKVR